MSIHKMIDADYGADGDERLKQLVSGDIDLEATDGELKETALHVAARRRRLTACEILLDHGADIDAKNGAGKTAYAHAVRRRFTELAEMFESRGCNQELNAADQLAVAVVELQLDAAKKLIDANPGCVRTGNPEEDRLLADVAGRNETEPVKLLMEAGADLAAPAMDNGTPLHQAAWFGQPDNARLLIDAGAPIDPPESYHGTTPLGWAVHGSQYSGGADERQDVYIALVTMLLDAGASLDLPKYAGSQASYYERLLKDASPAVRELLVKAKEARS